MAKLNLRTPNAYAGRKATSHNMGTLRFATAAEAAAGTATDVALTPATGAVSVPAATTTVAGIVKLATNAQSVTGTNTTAAVTPDDLTARLASPGAIGGTTPAAGTFTAVTASTGDITATAGNMIIGTAGKTLEVKAGMIGSSTLASGTVAISITGLTTGHKAFIQRTGIGVTSTTLGEIQAVCTSNTLTVTSLILGTPGSTQTADVSTFSYFCVLAT